ncbi:hypothetical protein ACIBI9_00750 [Nonomuraea sp. NPDC050451]|uniref:hypothetical protein n=1 Tax=Nonomuraea sp. NPDC050451 TaxID=3364364 RepID=UPI0037A43FDD
MANSRLTPACTARRGNTVGCHSGEGVPGSDQTVFQAALHQGEDGEPPLLTSSPCTGFRLPTTPVTSRAVLYLTAVHDIDPDTALFIITEMATGLRWGEIAGLHVTHLDPAGRQIHIVQTYAYLLDENTGRRRWRLKPHPKGKKQRVVPISPDLTALIIRHAEGSHADQPLFQSRTGSSSTTTTSATASSNRPSRSPTNVAWPNTSPHTLFADTMITMLRDGGVAPGVMQLIAATPPAQRPPPTPTSTPPPNAP